MTLVSAVIPCYNQAALVGEAIESVISRSHRPIETILVDDRSTDDTAEVASSYGVRCIRQENRGVAEARNTGLRASMGAYGRWAVVEASQQIGSGRLLAAASALWILLKYDPRGLLSAIAGGLRQTAATLARGTPAR